MFNYFNHSSATILHTPFTVTSEVCENEITGSPGTCMLALHVNLHLPAMVA